MEISSTRKSRASTVLTLSLQVCHYFNYLRTSDEPCVVIQTMKAGLQATLEIPYNMLMILGSWCRSLERPVPGGAATTRVLPLRRLTPHLTPVSVPKITSKL